MSVTFASTPQLLIANWKMNLTVNEGRLFVRALKGSTPAAYTTIGIAPMSVGIDACLSEVGDADIHIGAQNCHWASDGAFTGEISATALKAMGTSFVIIGHSERRSIFSEGLEESAERAMAAIKAGLVVVFCIGESFEERQHGETIAILKRQLQPLLERITVDDHERVVIAYEPVWAIGTGLVASNEQIEETHSAIAAWLNHTHSWQSPRIIYGGSVKPENYAGILALPTVHGALVGGASLRIDSFMALFNISEELGQGDPQERSVR